MLAKIWKKLGLLILIIACVFNIMNKLVHKLSIDKEMIYSAEYMQENSENSENKEKSVNKENNENNSKTNSIETTKKVQ